MKAIELTWPVQHGHGRKAASGGPSFQPRMRGGTRRRRPCSQGLGLRRNGGHGLRETMKAKAPMNESVTQPKRIRRKFDKAFKQRAVELWLNSGRTATEVAAELGIHPQRLSAWRRRFAPPPPGGEGGGGAKRRAEQLETENSSLRREADYRRQQRDILK